MKMLRFLHILEIFSPFKLMIDYCMSDSIAKKRDNIF